MAGDDTTILVSHVRDLFPVHDIYRLAEEKLKPFYYIRNINLQNLFAPRH